MRSMTSMPFATNEPITTAQDGLLSDYRQRRALEERERADLKRADQAEQCATLNSADLRIRAWEKVHQLPALGAIAAATQLTLADIQNEQRLRSARRASAVV
jgi:hypothetical protein